MVRHHRRVPHLLALPQQFDSGKALLDEIHCTAGHVQWLREKVQGDELVWAVPSTRTASAHTVS